VATQAWARGFDIAAYPDADSAGWRAHGRTLPFDVEWAIRQNGQGISMVLQVVRPRLCMIPLAVTALVDISLLQFPIFGR